MIERWESVHEYVTEFRNRGLDKRGSYGFSSDLGVNTLEALRRCEVGDPSIVGKVTEAVDKIQSTISSSNPGCAINRRSWAVECWSPSISPTPPSA